MTIIDFEIGNFTNDNIIKILDYLTEFEDQGKLIADDVSFQSICYLRTISFIYGIPIEWSIYSNKNSQDLFGNILLYLSSICNKFDFETDQIEKTYVPNASLNKKRISIFSALIELINSISSTSIDFNVKFNSSVGLKALIEFLKNDSFVEKIVKEKKSNLLICLLGNLNWLSKCSDDSKSYWQQLGAYEILGKLKNLNENEKLTVYQATVNIATDKQLEKLNDAIVTTFVGYLEKSAAGLVNGTCIKKTSEILEGYRIIKKKINLLCLETTVQSIVGILICLYKICLNDAKKKEVYFMHTVKDSLKTILFKGTLVEAMYALKLIGQLSFNPRIASDLSGDVQLVDYIQMIINQHNRSTAFDYHSDEFNLADICKQIKWNLNLDIANEKAKIVKKKKIKKKTSDNDQHIMISYQISSKDICSKIKSYLESIGYKVWMDVTGIHGLSLDSMCRAVEGSFCVLICVTEKYRQSINCQLEAQYVVKMKKPIIPLILQSGYENASGWLNLIMFEKSVVNFVEDDFEECMEQVIVKVKAFVVVKDSVSAVSESTNSLKVDPGQIVEKWSSEKTKEWFAEKGLNMNIFNSLKPCTGEILIQVYDMKTRSPEFYYQSLSKINQVDLRSIMLFSSCIDKLLGSKK